MMDTAVAERPKTSKLATVRVADVRDTFGMLDTLTIALSQSETGYPAPDMPYAAQAMMDLIAQGLVFVAVDSADKVVGCLALDSARWPWTAPNNPEGWHLYNQHFWVEPAYRGAGIARALLALAKGRAESWVVRPDYIGVPLVIDVSMLDGDTGLKERFVKMCGFTYIGAKLLRRRRSS